MPRDIAKQKARKHRYYLEHAEEDRARRREQRKKWADANKGPVKIAKALGIKLSAARALLEADAR